MNITTECSRDTSLSTEPAAQRGILTAQNDAESVCGPPQGKHPAGTRTTASQTTGIGAPSSERAPFPGCNTRVSAHCFSHHQSSRVTDSEISPYPSPHSAHETGTHRAARAADRRDRLTQYILAVCEQLMTSTSPSLTNVRKAAGKLVTSSRALEAVHQVVFQKLFSDRSHHDLDPGTQQQWEGEVLVPAILRMVAITLLLSNDGDARYLRSGAVDVVVNEEVVQSVCDVMASVLLHSE